MCNGSQTEMACGHVLTHYTQRCAKGQQQPCPEPQPDAPRDYLPDSCAKCDPEFQKSQLSRDHKNHHEELIAQLLADKRVGRSKEARRLLECMERMRVNASRAIGEVKTAGSSTDVEFPGGGSHRMAPKTTSKWVDGKCVWGDDERLHRLGSSRIKVLAASAKSTAAATVEGKGDKVQPLIPGPPRLRKTKKEYVNRLPEEKELPQISGPPRLSTNKPYSGPRENVVAIDAAMEKWQVLQPQPYLRRTKKYANGLNFSNSSDQESIVTVKNVGEEQGGRPSSSDSQSSVRTVVRAEPTMRITLEADDSDEDMWLQLAEKIRPVNVIGRGPLRSFKDRVSSA
ncbi:hypothetical protein F4781DRAFT_220181 [Annulohypoxylon bovei var. microspora]|nr:hypothetical protein F4781DRAFT_220181 [Annulohypoxylon bovei var. microspora]